MYVRWLGLKFIWLWPDLFLEQIWSFNSVSKIQTFWHILRWCRGQTRWFLKTTCCNHPQAAAVSSPTNSLELRALTSKVNHVKVFYLRWSDLNTLFAREKSAEVTPAKTKKVCVFNFWCDCSQLETIGGRAHRRGLGVIAIRGFSKFIVFGHLSTSECVKKFVHARRY